MVKTPDRVWLFDLDNTLHDATPHIFPHINRSMTAYLQTHLDLDEEGANRLRMEYWHRYGATLLGLMKHHGTDPHHFLWHTHQFPALPEMVVQERGLRHTLKRLPGRKLIFSNAPAQYSHAVLDVLGIADLFEDVYCIERTRFRPKPSPHGFRQILGQRGLRAAQCVMVEDSLENLRTARKLGMRTVWVTGATRRPSYVDVCIRSISRLRAELHRL